MLKKRRTLSDADCSSYTVILMTHPHRLNLSSTLMNREHQVVNWSERMYRSEGWVEEVLRPKIEKQNLKASQRSESAGSGNTTVSIAVACA